MSFYQTNNSSIVRFNVRDPARQIIAPFQTLQRVAQIQKIGAGTGAHFTGTCAGTTNNSFLLTPEQIQNGALIINPVINTGANYTLPSAYSLQEFLGGRGAFNMISQNTGANDFFVLNVYNIATVTGVIHSFTDGTNQKTITQAAIANDAVLTPVLIEFTGVNSSYASVNNAPNYVGYTIY